MTQRAWSTLATALLLATSMQRSIPAVASDTNPAELPLIVLLHAEGVQLYECKAGPSGTPVWHFREPIATLIENGRSVGRHFAGPTWELDDGSAVNAHVVARAPGEKPEDIPLLWLEARAHRGNGKLSETATVERLSTKGGVASGACNATGAFLSVPYSADYAFRSSRR